nr:hypothetical protein [Pseudonocardia sp.]
MTISWSQALAWRMRRHLLEPVGTESVVSFDDDADRLVDRGARRQCGPQVIGEGGVVVVAQCRSHRDGRLLGQHPDQPPVLGAERVRFGCVEVQYSDWFVGHHQRCRQHRADAVPDCDKWVAVPAVLVGQVRRVDDLAGVQRL